MGEVAPLIPATWRRTMSRKAAGAVEADRPAEDVSEEKTLKITIALNQEAEVVAIASKEEKGLQDEPKGQVTVEGGADIATATEQQLLLCYNLHLRHIRIKVNTWVSKRADAIQRNYGGSCVQLRLSFSSLAPLFLYFIQWLDCGCCYALPSYLGLFHILICK
ncbi:hypothetical protein ACJX0J_015441, partial [Zea mays]